MECPRKGLNSQEEEVTLRSFEEVHQGVGILAREIGGQDFSACVLFDRRLTGLLLKCAFMSIKMTG